MPYGQTAINENRPDLKYSQHNPTKVFWSATFIFESFRITKITFLAPIGSVSVELVRSNESIKY